jgi:hypothetical protein
MRVLWQIGNSHVDARNNHVPALQLGVWAAQYPDALAILAHVADIAIPLHAVLAATAVLARYPFHGYSSTHLPWTFTNSVRDFNRLGAEQVGGKLSDLNVPAVFVIKKNSNTLKNLIQWLKEYNARGGGKTVDAPMLVIDDEADNASINIKHEKGEVSRINGQIRELLEMFERSCYIGYSRCRCRRSQQTSKRKAERHSNRNLAEDA